MCVQNDILVAIDKRHCVMLLLLDLSAAFDTDHVDHDISLQDCTLNTLSLAQLLNGFAPTLLIAHYLH